MNKLNGWSVAAAVLCASALAAPCFGAEPEPQKGSPLVASGWCTVKAKRSDGPGCDAGVGAALVTRGRLSWVAVVGTKTVGTGFAWTAFQPTPQFPRAVAVGIGIVADRNATGIGRRIYPAFGATVSFFSKKE